MDPSESKSDSGCSLDGSHIEPGEVSDALWHGFGDSERRRQVFLHFWAGCPSCHERLKAEGEPPRTGPPSEDPLVLTLRAWLAVRDGPEDVLRSLWPTPRHVLEGAPDERSRFRRAFVELGYEAATHRPPQEALEILKSVLRDVSEPRIEPSEELHDLRGLALAYLAEAFQVRRDFLQADEHFGRAEEELGKGSGEPEVLATVYELQADLLQAQGAGDEALRRLESAGRLLARTETFSGRLSEHLVRKAIALHRAGDSKAAETFAEARSTLAASGVRAPRLEIEIVHRLAGMDVAEGRFEKALGRLREIEPLYREFPTELVDVQRRWLEGTSLFRLGRYTEAEGPLVEALRGYYRLQLWEGATYAFLSLGQLFAVTGQMRRFEDFEEEFVSLLWSPVHVRNTLERLRRAVRIAKELEIRVPQLHEALALFEKAREDNEVN